MTNHLLQKDVIQSGYQTAPDINRSLSTLRHTLGRGDTFRHLCFRNSGISALAYYLLNRKSKGHRLSPSEKLDRKADKIDDKRIMNARKVSYQGKPWIELPEGVSFFSFSFPPFSPSRYFSVGSRSLTDSYAISFFVHSAE